MNALIPCLGTSLILLTGGNLKYFRKLFINKFLIFSGKISYSLYLTHWPLIIFYKYMVLHPLSNLEKIILILVTIIISTFSYIFIELPFRKKTYNIYLISTRNVILSFILTFFSIILVSNYLISNDKYVKLNKEKQATINKLKKDDELFKNFEAKATDRIRNNIYFQNNKKKIKTLIWGDSHGGDLYRSLNINEEFSRLDVEFLSYDYFYCFKEKNFKDKIVQYIKDNIITLHSCEKKVQNFPYYDILTSSDIIILSSRWTEKIDFKKIVTFIRNYNSKNIIVFGRKPRFFHIPTLYIKSNNNLNYLAYVNRNKETSNINKEIKIKSEKNNLIFFDIENLVCHDDECIVSEENDLLISDEDHWSYRGSIYYGKKLIENNFLEIILENAK